MDKTQDSSDESSAEENFSEDERANIQYPEQKANDSNQNKSKLSPIIVIGVVLLCLALVIAIRYFFELMDERQLIDFHPNKYLQSNFSIRNATYTSKRWGVPHPIKRMLALKDGNLAITSHDNTIDIFKIINLDINKTIQTLKGHKKQVFNLAVLDEDRIVSSSIDGSIKLWKLSANDFKATFYTKHFVFDMIILSDGFIAGICNQLIQIWDPTIPWYIRIFNGALFKSIKIPNNIVAHILIELKNGNLATGGYLNTTNSSSPENPTGFIHIWDTNTGEIINTIKHERSITGLVLFDDSLVSSSQDGFIRIWNTTSYTLIKELPQQISSVTDLAVLKDNSLVSCSYGIISFWDLSQGEVFKDIKVGYNTAHMIVLENGNLALFPMINATFFEIWDTDTNVVEV